MSPERTQARYSAISKSCAAGGMNAPAFRVRRRVKPRGVRGSFLALYGAGDAERVISLEKVTP